MSEKVRAGDLKVGDKFYWNDLSTAYYEVVMTGEECVAYKSQGSCKSYYALHVDDEVLFRPEICVLGDLDVGDRFMNPRGSQEVYEVVLCPHNLNIKWKYEEPEQVAVVRNSSGDITLQRSSLEVVVVRGQ